MKFYDREQLEDAAKEVIWYMECLVANKLKKL